MMVDLSDHPLSLFQTSCCFAGTGWWSLAEMTSQYRELSHRKEPMQVISGRIGAQEVHLKLLHRSGFRQR